jgi:2-dehydropantoate 2-reductase
MRVCIYGAGAIGGYVGALLAEQGMDVTLIARGPNLAAMRENGMRVITEEREFVVRPRCTDDPAEAGEQDYVFISLKAPSVPKIAGQMAPLFGPDTAVVTAQNGIPWWYFYGLEGPWQNRQLETVDPGNKQWDLIGPERAIGCVVWLACELDAPGVVRHVYGNRMPIGEPDGTRSDRAKALSKALVAAGLKSPARTDIRNDIWMKLWGNLSFNPISALTHATLDTLGTEPAIKAVARDMMVEAQAVAEKLGITFAIDVDTRIEGAANVGAHKTSMLQDLEQGRPMEIDALTGVVAELGRLVDVPTPTIDTVYALVVQRAKEAGCYPA